MYPLQHQKLNLLRLIKLGVIQSFFNQFTANMFGALLIAAICGLTLQPFWQASGNLNAELAMIRGYIDATIEAGSSVETAAKSISDNCNDQWDIFWNVAIISLANSSADAVLYGYAFRDRWYWHNNYGANSKSYIIWKDYSCVMRESIFYTPASEDDLPLLNQVEFSFIDNRALGDDVWAFAKEIHERMLLYTTQQVTGGTDTSRVGVSMIVVNEVASSVSIRACVSEDARKYSNHVGFSLFAVFLEHRRS